MGDGEGLEEMMCPNWDTFCSVSSDGGGNWKARFG